VPEAPKYQFVRGHYGLFPYTAEAGAYPEDMLVSLWSRLKTEGLWDVVFHENPSMTLSGFMKFFAGSNNLLQICSIMRDEAPVDMAGMAWLADPEDCPGGLRKAYGSFLFFKDYQKPAFTDPFCKMILEFWYQVLGMTLVVGMTPSRNRPALIYVKRSGFKEVARLPGFTSFEGQIDDAVLTAMTRADYLSLNGGGRVQ
jgi:hypothetical protein